MSTGTSTATVIKRGRKFQVQVDGKDVGKPTTKAKAEAERDKLNGVTQPEPESTAVETPETPEQTAETTPEPEAAAPETPAPAKPKTPEEQAASRLEGLDAKAAEKEIKKWQGLLEDAREQNAAEAIKTLEAMIAYGDQHMSTLEDGGTPKTAAQKRAAKAAEARAAKERAEAEAAAASEQAAETRTTSSGRAAPRPSTISKDGEMKCTGLPGKEDSPGCGQVKPVTKFPTKSATERATECRDCREARKQRRLAQADSK